MDKPRVQLKLPSIGILPKTLLRLFMTTFINSLRAAATVCAEIRFLRFHLFKVKNTQCCLFKTSTVAKTTKNLQATLVQWSGASVTM